MLSPKAVLRPARCDVLQGHVRTRTRILKRGEQSVVGIVAHFGVVVEAPTPPLALFNACTKQAQTKSPVAGHRLKRNKDND